MQRDPAGPERLGVLEPVLLVVDDHQVGVQGDDRVDVGILRAAHRRQSGLVAEPGAGDRPHAEREERLGCRRNERDDAHYSRSSSWFLRRSNSSALMCPWSRSWASCSIRSATVAPPPGPPGPPL